MSLPTYMGMPMIESRACCIVKPVREHVKRRTQREAYHRRISKKWVKRYGTKREPAFMLANLDCRQVMFVHPDLMKKLRTEQLALDISRAKQ